MNQRIGRLNFPVNMAFLPDGRILIAEQQGFVKVFKNGAIMPGVALTLDSVYSQNEKGLLGLAVDPNFTATGYVYFYYTCAQQGNIYQGQPLPGTPVLYKIVRYTMNGDIFPVNTKQTIIDLEITPGFIVGVNHDGGQMQIGPDGKLYLAIGDAELWCSSSCMNLFSTNCNCGPTWIPPTWPDEMNTYLGKILRINPDGTAPADNPYYSSPTPVTKQQRYFVAKGMRNPFTMTFKGNSNELFVGDVGSSPAAQREEINLVTVPGLQKHLGYPHGEGILNNPLYYDPIFAYSGGANSTALGCAIVGMTYFKPTSTNWPSIWQDKLFYMDLCNGYINTLDVNNGNVRTNFARNMLTNPNNVVSGDGNIGLNTGVDGNMYYLARSGTASVVGIYRISYQPITVTSFISTTTSNVITACGQTLQFNTVFTPSNATNQAVIFTTSPSSIAGINSSGLLTPLSNGIVTVSTISVGNYSLINRLVVTISGQSGLTPQITVNGVGNIKTIGGIGGTLQVTSNVFPICQGTNVNWSIQSISGSAVIGSNGIITATGLGTIRVIATLASNSSIIGSNFFTIVGVCATNITQISLTTTGLPQITTDKGSIAINMLYTPSWVCNTTTSYSISGVSGCANGSITSNVLSSTFGNGLIIVSGRSVLNSTLVSSILISVTGQNVPVSSINVDGIGGNKLISVLDGTLGMVSTVLSSCATNNSIRWSILSITGNANINSITGVITAVGNGVVQVVAQSVSTPSITGSALVTITGQCNNIITGLIITATGGATQINTDKGSLQLGSNFTPSFVCNPSILWSITGVSGCAGASISGTGLLTSNYGNGIVTVTGTSVSNNTIKNSYVVNLVNQIVPVTAVTIIGLGGVSSISAPNGTLQILPSVTPICATNSTVLLSIINGSGSAIINTTTGIITATGNGIVSVTGTSVSNPTVKNTIIITITGQCSPSITNIILQSVGNVTSLAPGNALQLYPVFTPSFVCNSTTGYVITATSGLATATVNGSGLVSTGGGNGVITILGYSIPFPTLKSTYVLTLNTGFIQVSNVTITSSGNNFSINIQNGTLSLGTSISPSNASNNAVSWSIVSGTGTALINAIGSITATGNGLVLVKATSISNPTVAGFATITITGQCAPFVSSVTVTSPVNVISSAGGNLAMGTVLNPSFACNTGITWSVISGINCAAATISGAGILQSTGGNGIITVIGTSVATPSVSGIKILSISGQNIGVTSVSISNSNLLITSNGGNLQMTNTISPVCATNQAVTWSVNPNSNCASASISGTGLLQSLGGNGVVTVVCTSIANGSAVSQRTVTISGQVINVTSVGISNVNPQINTANGNLQLNNTIAPLCATNQSVTWAILSNTSCVGASISGTGLLQSFGGNGVVTVVCTSVQNPSIKGYSTVTISGQTINVNTVQITNINPNINSPNGSIQMNSAITPICATNSNVIWSVIQGSNCANTSITGAGLLQSIGGNGVVTVVCTSVSNGSAISMKEVTISGQTINVTSVAVTNISPQINTPNGSIQLNNSISPVCASNQNVTWGILSTTSCAGVNISGTGLLISNGGNGIVTVVCTSVQSPSVKGYSTITISGQSISVASIIITNSNPVINSQSGTLQMSNSISPSCATNQNVNWTVQTGGNCGSATISPTGLLQTNGGNGTVTVTCASVSNGSIFNSKIVTITGQNININSVAITNSNPSISVQNGNLQMFANVLPSCATNTGVNWSVINSSCTQTSISGSGLLSSYGGNGFVTVIGTSISNNAISGWIVVTITNHILSVTSININNINPTISNQSGTLQMQASILPICANNQGITWSVSSITGNASIDPNTGLLSAISNGTVSVTATSIENSAILVSKICTISGQCTPISSLIITALGTSKTISANKGTIVLGVITNPSILLCNSVIGWSIIGQFQCASGSISGNGLLQSTGGNGKLVVKASTSNQNVFAIDTINVNNQVIPVNQIFINPKNKFISSKNAVFNFATQILPSCATDVNIVYTITSGNSNGILDASTGAFTATGDGMVTVTATNTNNPYIKSFAFITITGQNIPVIQNSVQSITLSISGPNAVINTPNGTLQFAAIVSPSNATNTNVKWSVLTVSGKAKIDSTTGLLTAISDGKIIVFATSASNGEISGSMIITISGQGGVNTEVESKETRGIVIYPNPNNGVFLMVADNIRGKVELFVVNEIGQEVYSETIESFEGIKQLNLAALPKAIYKVSIVTKNGVYHRLVSIQ
ncbi:MAG: PQQ-dependent sugar dehydrogenase [Bacteroidota bacterium]|nr:PQQ-dependent sugar dehydrogenase [Bacteroidota bacterium]